MSSKLKAWLTAVVVPLTIAVDFFVAIGLVRLLINLGVRPDFAQVTGLIMWVVFAVNIFAGRLLSEIFIKSE